MNLSLLILLSIFISSKIDAQDIPVDYSLNIATADSFYSQKAYLQAGKYYNLAFRNKLGMSSDYHRLLSATSWAKAGFIDSAVVNLYFLVYAFNFSDCEEIKNRLNNTTLISHPEFNKLLGRCYCTQRKKKLPFQPVVAKLLDSIYLVDQASRSLQNYDQVKSVVVNNNNQELNMKIIDSIYAIHGWFSISEVGYNASQAQFLVIQHSDLATQVKRFPRIKQAVDNCLLAPGNLALLTDRILVGSRKKQLYGTQPFYDAKQKKYVPFPIEKPKSVNIRRAKMGMISIEQEMNAFN